MKNKDKKIIELTKEQYLTLAKLAYLGNWMANAQRTGQEGDPNFEEYESMSDYIFSLAPTFDFSKDLEHELECGNHEETTEVSKIHEEYDEQTFWDELPERLGDRDFYKRYSKQDWEKMTRDERFLKMQECIIAWEEELEEHGIGRLDILKQAKDFGIQI